MQARQYVGTVCGEGGRGFSQGVLASTDLGPAEL